MSDAVQRTRDGSIERITINRPAALNAINEEVLDGLEAAVADLRSATDVRAVVVTGAGEKAFVAGADIGFMSSLTPVRAELFAERGQGILDGLAALPMPVIAAVSGFALGGGCEIAMACDLIIADATARFGQPEVKLGVIPGFGGTQRLARRVGLSNALDLCLTGRMVGAEEALRMGLASQVVEGKAADAATEIARGITSLGPVALRLCKRAIHENVDAALSTAQAAERTLFGMCFATEDQKEGMAAFLEKRSAAFQGR
ncbi:MAG: enoyl-CoA hydratase/isomerase family protein [Myxococcales bacterium]|nr:enoyl-CoA hydratase/isomerase family protein [Myxococcales bacterium]